MIQRIADFTSLLEEEIRPYVWFLTFIEDVFVWVISEFAIPFMIISLTVWATPKLANQQATIEPKAIIAAYMFAIALTVFMATVSDKADRPAKRIIIVYSVAIIIFSGIINFAIISKSNAATEIVEDLTSKATFCFMILCYTAYRLPIIWSSANRVPEGVFPLLENYAAGQEGVQKGEESR